MSRKRRGTRPIQWTVTGLLFVLLMLLAAAGHAQVGVRSLGVAPVETVLLSQPKIVWRVTPSNGVVKSVNLTLNGKAVSATYDTSCKSAVGIPDTPLAPGLYSVRCELILDNGRSYPKLWSFTVADNALPRPPAPTAEAEKAFTLINQLRLKTGLPAYRLDECLCAAACDFSKSMANQHVNGAGHTIELPSLVKNYCYPGQCFESVGLSFAPVNAMVHNFFDGPYHRSAFLQPGACDVGVGVCGDKTKGFIVTLLFSLCEETKVEVYPRDGQKDVPLVWDAQQETANPLKVHGVAADSPVGYPITLFAMGPYGSRLEGVKATLTTEGGAAVPFYLNTPENDKANLENGVVLIPKQPLKPGTTYLVTVTAKDETDEIVEQKWKFTTANK